MPDKIDAAIAELRRLGGGVETLEIIENQRRKDSFVRYWQPFPHEEPALRAFDETSKVFVVTGGNRSGKTELGAFLCVAWLLGKSYFRGEPAWEWVKDLPIPEGRPRNVWVVGLDFNVLRDVIWREKLLLGKEHPGFIPKDNSIEKINEADRQIFAKDGSVLTCKSADSGWEKFQGASVDLVWIDEECEATIFNECYQRTVDCAGRLLVTLTPLVDVSSGVREPWVFNLNEDMQRGQKDIVFVRLSVLDNPAVPETEKKKLLEKWAGHPEERARLYGEFIRRSGLVYFMWDAKKHLVKPSLDISEHKDYYRIVSIDPAATGVTAALWGAVDRDGNLYLYREYYDKELVVSEHAKNIRVRNKGDRIDMWLIDPKWGTQRNAETHKTNMQLYRDAGIPVRLAEVGEDFGLNASREYVQATLDENGKLPKLRVFDDLHNFKFEIERYTWDRFERGPLKGLSKEKPRKRDDHLMNAFQYMCAMRPKQTLRALRRPSDDEVKRMANLNSYFS